MHFLWSFSGAEKGGLARQTKTRINDRSLLQAESTTCEEKVRKALQVDVSTAEVSLASCNPCDTPSSNLLGNISACEVSAQQPPYLTPTISLVADCIQQQETNPVIVCQVGPRQQFSQKLIVALRAAAAAA